MYLSKEFTRVRIVEWPTLITSDQIHSFLGLAGYYQRFIKDFAAIAFPHFRLWEKNRELKWTSQCAAAFQTLKHELTSSPILTLSLCSRLRRDSFSTSCGWVRTCHSLRQHMNFSLGTLFLHFLPGATSSVYICPQVQTIVDRENIIHRNRSWSITASYECPIPRFNLQYGRRN